MDTLTRVGELARDYVMGGETVRVLWVVTLLDSVMHRDELRLAA